MGSWSKIKKAFDRRPSGPTQEELEEEIERKNTEEKVRQWIAESKLPESIRLQEKKQEQEAQSNGSTDASNESTNSARTERPPLDTIHEGIIHAVSAVHEGIVNLPSGILAHAESVFSFADAWNSATSCQVNRNPLKARGGATAAHRNEGDVSAAANRPISPSMSRKASGAQTEQRLPSHQGSDSTAAAAAAAGGDPKLSRSSSLQSGGGSGRGGGGSGRGGGGSGT
jgi:hypothetical protein